MRSYLNYRALFSGYTLMLRISDMRTYGYAYLKCIAEKIGQILQTRYRATGYKRSPLIFEIFFIVKTNKYCENK